MNQVSSGLILIDNGGFSSGTAIRLGPIAEHVLHVDRAHKHHQGR